MSVWPVETPILEPLRTAGLAPTPELESLLSCVRRALTRNEAGKVAEPLRQPFDWVRLTELARRHGLLPLVYWNLSRNPEFSSQARMLLDYFQANARRNLLLVAELIRLVEMLGSHGIQLIPFKGPAAAEALYGIVALRECADLDFLVRRRDVAEAIRVLTSNGYSPIRKMTQVQQRALVATHYEYGLVSPAGILIELQWRIVPQYFSLRCNEEEYWQRARKGSITGREILELSPEDLLLLLCFHGSKHRWSKLIWIADVGKLVNANPDLDWEYVLESARRAGGLRMVRLGLLLARALLQATIPAGALQGCEGDRTAKQISAEICNDLMLKNCPGYVRSQLYLLRIRERWRDRARYVFRFVFTSTPMEWTIVHVPRPLFAAYRVLRVLRGLVKGFFLATNAMARLARTRL